MARWEPNASRRLADAALERFAENGYENTTVLDIAKRAGLAKSTFFRHFQDKRGILFGEELLTEQLVTTITAAPAGTTPLEAVGCGLDALGQNVFTPDHRRFTVRRRQVIDAHPDLQEREALKSVSLTESLAAAIADRGVPDLVAQAAAQLGALALKRAYEQWCDLGNADEFSDIGRRALGEVQAAVSVV